MVTMSLSEHNAMQFDTVTLVCHVTGSPVISVHWYHNALPVVTSQEIIVSRKNSMQRDFVGRFSAFAPTVTDTVCINIYLFLLVHFSTWHSFLSRR